jgi:hypothetical protein
MTAQNTMKPSIFVGSSGQALPVARAVQSVFARDADVTLWTQGVFPLSSLLVHQLLEATRRHDYAIFVLADDDLAIVRGEVQRITRDNVLFELGIFMATVGLERTFLMVSSAAPDFRLPTDLAGITVTSYDPRSHNANLRGAVGASCADILDAIGKNHPLSGEWSLFISGSQHVEPNGVMIFVAARDKVNARLRLSKDTDGKDAARDFVYEGRYIAGQVVLTFEQGGAQDQIVGTVVLRFRADRLVLEGRTTFWHHDKAKMVTTDFNLRRRAAN